LVVQDGLLKIRYFGVIFFGFGQEIPHSGLTPRG